MTQRPFEAFVWEKLAAGTFSPSPPLFFFSLLLVVFVRQTTPHQNIPNQPISYGSFTLTASRPRATSRTADTATWRSMSQRSGVPNGMEKSAKEALQEPCELLHHSGMSGGSTWAGEQTDGLTDAVQPRISRNVCSTIRRQVTSASYEHTTWQT